MKKAIVTGANSFVGSAVVHELLAHDVEVFALVHEGRANRLSKSEHLHVTSFDVQEDASFGLPKDTYDACYHFAWVGGTNVSFRKDYGLQLKNAIWTADVVRMAAEAGCRKFVAAGSIMEREIADACHTQGCKPGMGYCYGVGKLAAHMIAQSQAAACDVEFIWALITNAYGVGERSTRMVNTTIRKCIAGESPQFTAGTQNYDFVYIDDVARAFYLLGEHGKPFHEYLIGSGTARPLKEFLLEMKQSIAPDLAFVFGDIPFTGTNLPLSAFDCSQTEQDTGFRANVSFAEGTLRTRDWMKRLEAEHV
ncbi:NAD(P)-dependent oxidoreductase [uncultured Selenomonas sp.]|uniref:NAD-dependent epimerase/dehydratase family protein n=1 Tax=uncultured Selenomonas sp. TaxID=159275 RepID=UPI0025D68E8C|nr:NAD-dependent epimerase/dehydratase [uncultured Selenomonas sp.]